MAYPDVIKKIISPGHLRETLFEIGHMLNDAGATFDETYDGSTREVPAGGDLAASTNQWQPGGTLTGFCWIAGRFSAGVRSSRCGFFIQYNASVLSARVHPIPSDQWVAGGGSDSNPSKPGGVSSNNISGTVGDLAAVTDGSMLAFVVLTGLQNVYMGEVSPVQSEADDPYPYVLYDSSAGWEASSWRRISPIDESTSITGAASTPAPGPDTALDQALQAVWVGYSSSGHRHIMGIAKHIAHGLDFAGAGIYTYTYGDDTRGWIGYEGTACAVIRNDGTDLGTELTVARISYDIELPSTDPPPDSTAPEISNFVPATGSTVEAVDTIQFDITDNLDSFAAVMITVHFEAQGVYEVVHDGTRFGPQYSGQSTRTAITDGYRFVLRRREGWIGSPVFHAVVVDSSGNNSVIT